MNIGIISQARMGSSRLPGKVLMTARGITMLEFHVNRLQASGLPLYIATTTLAADDLIEDQCFKLSIPCFRGSSDDVLSRYFEAAKQFGLDALVRVTSDCPLIDGKLVSKGVERYLAAEDSHLYLSNGIVRTYPRGLDFEVFSMEMLTDAQCNATSLSDREHVTPYIHQNRSGKIQYAHITRATDASALRLTLDTVEDYTLLRTLLEEYNADKLDEADLVNLMNAHPELVNLNASIEQKRYNFSK
ncbi:cytidylyltransferase domain-containing protein [Hymenobacter tenuis]